MFEQETSSLLDILLNDVNNEDALDSFIKNDISSFTELSLANFFKKICEEKGLTKGKLIKAADLDRNYGYQILDGSKKPTRDKILQLCFGANLDFKQTQRALSLGNVGELYPKNSRDAIIIYSIKDNLSLHELNEKLYDKGFSTLSDNS
ncbi:hypothetical protein QYB59_002263 [Clostridium perfringens]|nr:hypothetical protein [Clostridium perfringens]ELC8443233.1 hypothetical protein [Clostridium perfringens]MDZ4991995.1 hypothetical protein [Clostridium perfringens]